MILSRNTLRRDPKLRLNSSIQPRPNDVGNLNYINLLPL